MYWLIGTILVVIAIIIGEVTALRSNGKYKTLSQTIWDLGIKHPITFFLEGVFVGALAIHLYTVYSCH